MTYRVHVRSSAEADIERVVGWYEIEALAHLDSFEAELDQAMARIAVDPLVPRVLVAGARRMHLSRHPYELWYLVHEHIKTAEVIALVHDRQDLRATVARVAPSANR